MELGFVAHVGMIASSTGQLQSTSYESICEDPNLCHIPSLVLLIARRCGASQGASPVCAHGRTSPLIDLFGSKWTGKVRRLHRPTAKIRARVPMAP